MLHNEYREALVATKESVDTVHRACESISKTLDLLIDTFFEVGGSHHGVSEDLHEEVTHEYTPSDDEGVRHNRPGNGKPVGFEEMRSLQRDVKDAISQAGSMMTLNMKNVLGGACSTNQPAVCHQLVNALWSDTVNAGRTDITGSPLAQRVHENMQRLRAVLGAGF